MEKEPQGVQVGGRDPKALLLSDGTRLALEDEAGPGGRSDWTLVGQDGHDGSGLTVREAMRLAGDDHAEYVRVRTRVVRAAGRPPRPRAVGRARLTRCRTWGSVPRVPFSAASPRGRGRACGASPWR